MYVVAAVSRIYTQLLYRKNKLTNSECGAPAHGEGGSYGTGNFFFREISEALQTIDVRV